MIMDLFQTYNFSPPNYGTSTVADYSSRSSPSQISLQWMVGDYYPLYNLGSVLKTEVVPSGGPDRKNLQTLPGTYGDWC